MSPIKRTTVAAGAVIVVLAFTGFVMSKQPRDVVSTAHIEWVNGNPISTKLVVVYTAGPDPGCVEPHGVEVRETEQAVTLTAQTITRDVPPEGRACSAVGIETKRVVTLKSPLGARQVFDSFQQATGEPGILQVKTPPR